MPRPTIDSSIELYPHGRRLDMIKHLELALYCGGIQTDAHNFHYILAVFIANLPNNHGKAVRSNDRIMNYIGGYVAPESLFEMVNSGREQIRNEMDILAVQRANAVNQMDIEVDPMELEN